MIIKRPIETNRVTQGWGENKACVRTDISGRMIYPPQVRGKMGGICPFGTKNFYTDILQMKGHNGWDNLVYYREPLYFPAVADTKWWAKRDSDSASGIGVDVFTLDRITILEKDLPADIGEHAKQDWKDNGGKIRLKLRFWHLWDSALWGKPEIQIGTFADGRPQMGVEVKTGDLIGYCDNSGASSADHLHWAIKFTNKSSMTIGWNNGYKGACDLKSFYDDQFILDLYGKKPQLSASQRINKLILSVKEIKNRRILKSLIAFLFASGE